MKSTDDGETWNTLVLPVGGADFQLLIDPGNPQRLFASGLNGILGRVWAAAKPGSTIQKIYVRIFYPGILGRSLFAVPKTMKNHQCIVRMMAVRTGGESLGLLQAGACVIQPDSTQPGNLWAGLFGYGVYLTFNSGGSWIKKNSGISTEASIGTLAVSLNNQNVMYAAVLRPYPGVYRSQDGGHTWGSPLAGFENSPGIVGDGFRLVSPVGSKAANTWYPILEINKLLVHPQHPEIAWAATSREIYETLNGYHWTLLLSIGTAVDLSVSPANPDQPYAALYDARN